ncbi:MAG: DUF4230 domain-containing protein [Synergistes sp.]|nr:DUF4230 domain-containing protein [Synergistes sp.]
MSRRKLKKIFMMYYIFVLLVGGVGYLTMFGGLNVDEASGADEEESVFQVGNAPEIDFKTAKMIEDSLKEKMRLEIEEGKQLSEVLNYKDVVEDPNSWFKGIRNKIFGKELILNYTMTYEYEVDLENVGVQKTGDRGIQIAIPNCELTIQKSNLEKVGEQTGWLRSVLSAEEFQQIQKRCDEHYKNELFTKWQSGEQNRANELARNKVKGLAESLLNAAGKSNIDVSVVVR